jgi:hypothetical protein
LPKYRRILKEVLLRLFPAAKFGYFCFMIIASVIHRKIEKTPKKKKKPDEDIVNYNHHH